VDGSKYTVALSASNNSVTIKNVYAGSYTVTSEGWQWSYNLSDTNPKTASVSKDSTEKVSFTLSEKSDNPKHDSDQQENILKQE